MQNIELDTLPVYDNRYEINKKRKYGDKIYTTFWDLDIPEIYRTFLLILHLFVVCDNKYYLQIYLNNCVYKVVDKQMIDYLDDNLFETDGNLFV